MKKSKSRKSYKHIYIKTASAFLAFYIAMMAVITYVHAENIRKNMQSEVYNQVNVFHNIIEEASRSLYDPKYTPNDIVNKIYQPMSGIMTNLALKNIYVRAGVCDKNEKLIVKSGNMMVFENYITDNNHDVLNKDTQKCISLDNYMSYNEINEFFQKTNLHYRNNVNVIGYSKDQIVIPKKIQIYTYGNEGFDDIVILAEKEFEPKNVEGLELKEYNRSSAYLYFERIGEIGEITPKMQERYSYCDEIAEHSINSFIKNGGRTGPIKDNIFKGTHSIILTIGRDYGYFGVVYYPLEVAISQLVSVYVYCFLFVLILTLILSNRLVYIFKKQQKLEQNRKELTNAIAHELKTPLGIIRNFSEGLKENINIDKNDYYLDVIVDETDKMDKMILEMLNLSKLEANAYKLNIESFSLAELTQREIEKYKNLYNDKNLNIIFNYSNDCEVIADKTAFEYVISNFISNAVKYTPNGLNIKIDIEKINNKNIFTIENQGEKIPNEKLSRIWDSFFKGDDSRERKDGGTGLGLAIVKKYLELHKAKYGCENTEDGVKFWFKI